MFQKIRLLLRLIASVRNWRLYFSLSRKGDGTLRSYHLRNGMIFGLRPGTSDRLVFNDIWLLGTYDVPSFDWAQAKTVVDIGAHIGTFTLFAAAQNPALRVIAVEPEPSNIEVLERNIEANNLGSRIKIIEKGVAAKEGLFELNVMPGRGECNSLYRQTEDSHRIAVPVTTLERIFIEQRIEHCDFLKMNCEGAEYEIFASLPVSMYERISAMVINYHFYSSDPKHHPRLLIENLERNGFTVLKNKQARNFLIAVREKGG